MKYELNMMIIILSNPEECISENSITHIIQRYPYFITLGDACLKAGRGFSDKLFW